jgi:hypothetical protein
LTFAQELTAMLFARKAKTIAFEDAQRVLVSLLNEVGEHHWANHISRASSSSFRGLLGGMGSLNDLIICRANSHKIADDDDPRANTLLVAMIGVCAETSSRGAMTGEDASRRCAGGGIVLSGSRCLQCGHSFSGSRQVLSFVTERRLQRVLEDSSASDWPVGRLLDYWHTGEPNHVMEMLIDRLQAAGIEYSPGNGWMRPCRQCGSDDTCIYRWTISSDSVSPASDNLKLRNR